MIQQVHRLEQMLTYWEDQCFINSILSEHGSRLSYPEEFLRWFPFIGPTRHWRELRGHLRELGRHGGDLDSNRFTVVTELLASSQSSMFQFPLYLRDWTVSSRRSFHLNEEIQALLYAMSFHDIRWTDLLFPFDSFLVTFEVPIQTELDSYDAALVTRLYVPYAVRGADGEIGLSVGLLSSRLNGYRSIKPLEKDMLWRAARKGSAYVRQAIDHTNPRFLDPGPFVSTSVGPSYLQRFANESMTGGLPIASLSGEASRDTLASTDAVDRAFRLIAGLCLYLSSLEPESSFRSGWTRTATLGLSDPKAITRDAQVCFIRSSFVLSSIERSTFIAGAGRREMSAHFRRGHYRRRPGEGQNPDAPKIVLVRPTLIRGDRLASDELPGGSMAILKA